MYSDVLQKVTGIYSDREDRGLCITDIENITVYKVGVQHILLREHILAVHLKAGQGPTEPKFRKET